MVIIEELPPEPSQAAAQQAAARVRAAPAAADRASSCSAAEPEADDEDFASACSSEEDEFRDPEPSEEAAAQGAQPQKAPEGSSERAPHRQDPLERVQEQPAPASTVGPAPPLAASAHESAGRQEPDSAVRQATEGAAQSSDEQASEQDQQRAHDQEAVQAVLREAQARAEEAKARGNALYAEGRFPEAEEEYTAALEGCPEGVPLRAVLFANRAACRLMLKRYTDAAKDCSAAIAADSGYVKAYMRRARAYEELDDLERAYTDAKKVVELDPGNSWAAATLARLEPAVNERREKMKEEMLGKLKELGNTVLGKFGMSLDNFKAEKDPATGSYSINFKQ